MPDSPGQVGWDEAFIDLKYPSPPERRHVVRERAAKPSDVAISLAKALLASNKQRNESLSDLPLADPTWNMLLDLFVATGEGRCVSVSSLCLAAGAPTTTALRHIDQLVRSGRVARQADPNDGRRSFLQLSSSTEDQIWRLLTDLHERVENG